MEGNRIVAEGNYLLQIFSWTKGSSSAAYSQSAEVEREGIFNLDISFSLHVEVGKFVDVSDFILQSQ